MIKRIYAVHDSATKVFGLPFYAIRPEQAVRDFTYAANDPQTEIYRYANDYSLYFLGTFDDETGQIIHSRPEHVVNAFAVKNHELTEVAQA